MSPHAIKLPEEDELYDPTSHTMPTANRIDSQVNSHGSSHLYRHGQDEVQDLVCVGFGPASLAIAVALHDALEEGTPSLRTDEPKVRFLERQDRFAWHAGMLLPGAKMQITFIKDLATLRNPRSMFTFVNYLHEKGRLVQFANLGTFLPHRVEYEDYMRWCAGHFDNVVDYGQEVQSVEAGQKDPVTGAIEHFAVAAKDRISGQISTIKAKHVVIAAGGKPSIPECFPSNHPRILHSSQYATNVSDIFPPGMQPRSVAVIGAGQSAAEVFNNIPSRFPDAKSYLLIRGAALRPSDDSPFVNEIFDPERVDDVYSQHPEVRHKGLVRDRGTNYSVVRLELLEHIYDTLYSNRVKYANEEQWPQRILNHRNVTGMRDVEIDGRLAVELQIDNGSGAFCARKQSCQETLAVDLVVVASGYRRDAYEGILKGVQHLMPGGETRSNRWQVRRDYGIELEPGSVQGDAGIWLQGCNESTHGLSDTLLSILANRGGEMVQNVFGEHRGCVALNGHKSLNGLASD